MEEKKRIRRSAEERVAEIDEKIEQFNKSLDALADKREEVNTEFDEKEKKIEEKIKTLTKKKESILSPEPKKRRTRMTKKRKIEAIVKKAIEGGFTVDEIAELLSPEGKEETQQESNDTSTEE